MLFCPLQTFQTLSNVQKLFFFLGNLARKPAVTNLRRTVLLDTVTPVSPSSLLMSTALDFRFWAIQKSFFSKLPKRLKSLYSVTYTTIFRVPFCQKHPHRKIPPRQSRTTHDKSIVSNPEISQPDNKPTIITTELVQITPDIRNIDDP